MAAVGPSVVTRRDRVGNIALAQHINEYMYEQRFAPKNTVRTKNLDLYTHYLGFMSEALEMPVAQVLFKECSSSAVGAFYRSRLKCEAPASANRRLASVRHFHSSVAEKFAIHDLARSIRPIAFDQPRFRGLNDLRHSQLRRDILLAHPRNRFIVELLDATGLRRSEAAVLTLGQISDDWCWYLRVLSKGGRFREIPISTKHRRELLRYLDWRHKFPTLPSSPLLSRIDGESRGCSQLGVTGDTVAHICQSFNINAHSLRHTFALRFLTSRSAQKGGESALNELRVILGHTNIKTTTRYTIPHRDTLYQAMEAL